MKSQSFNIGILNLFLILSFKIFVNFEIWLQFDIAANSTNFTNFQLFFDFIRHTTLFNTLDSDDLQIINMILKLNIVKFVLIYYRIRNFRKGIFCWSPSTQLPKICRTCLPMAKKPSHDFFSEIFLSKT